MTRRCLGAPSVHGETLQVADGYGSFELPSSAGILTGSGADAPADRGEGVRLGSDLQGVVVATLGDETDVEAGVRPHGAGLLTGRPQILFAVPQPAAPALPGFLAAGDPPGVLLAPGHLARILRSGSRVRVEWLPATLGRQVGDEAPRRVRHAGHAALDGDGAGGALVGTDLAADAGRYLHGRHHHPRPYAPLAGNRGDPLRGLRGSARTGRSRHVETAHGTQVHADAAVEARHVIDGETVRHADLLSGRRRTQSAHREFELRAGARGLAEGCATDQEASRRGGNCPQREWRRVRRRPANCTLIIATLRGFSHLLPPVTVRIPLSASVRTPLGATHSPFRRAKTTFGSGGRDMAAARHDVRFRQAQGGGPKGGDAPAGPEAATCSPYAAGAGSERGTRVLTLGAGGRERVRPWRRPIA